MPPPLATPEDKAGLKARLMAHVETIADPDIKALYRRELLERFSAFAFPQREQQPWPPRQRKEWRSGDGKRPPPRRSSPEAVPRLRQSATAARARRWR